MYLLIIKQQEHYKDIEHIEFVKLGEIKFGL